MGNTLRDRLRAGAVANGTAPAEQHDRAEDVVPAELGDVKGHEEIVPVADRKALDLLKRYDEEFGEALPACVDRSVFFAAVRAVIPELRRCTPASVRQALLTCARFGLVPDGQQAVIKAEGTTAVFVPMYRGYVALMYRSGLVESVHVGRIYANDAYEFTPTAPSPDDFVHKPRLDLSREERGPVVLVYAFAWLKGGRRSQVIVLSREDAEEIRNLYSDSYQRAELDNSRSSFWHTHFEQMWEKSALLRLPRVVPVSAELRALTAADEAGDAGQVQIVHAPDSEAAELLAAADEAATVAEASQDPVSPVLERQRAALRRRAERRGGRGKKVRGGPKADA